MITPPAFASIRYQTYIIFAVLNLRSVWEIFAHFLDVLLTSPLPPAS